MGLNLMQDAMVVPQQQESLLLLFLQDLPTAADYTPGYWSNHEELWEAGMVGQEELRSVPAHLEAAKMLGQHQKKARLQMRIASRLREKLDY